jgi:hypothetical protein
LHCAAGVVQKMPEVLLIGWDGAGWSQINPLLDSGATPNLARLVESGVMGHLATLAPLCSPLLWTSVATGQFADRHGILDWAEPDPRTGGIRPVTRASLRASPIWDILAGEGLQCGVIGWPVTHPAAPPATCVSDGFAHGVPQSIYPPALESTILPLRFEPQEWTGDELQLFVPDLDSIDQDKDKRLARLAVLLAEAVSVHAAATTLLESGECDFSAVWFGAVGQACALFPDGTDEVYKEVVSGVYRFLDLLLGRLLSLAGSEAIVMLVSDRAASEAEWSVSTGCGPRGMLCSAGPGIQQDELIFGPGLLDIAPTILGLFGFAPVTGMAGRPIGEICATPPSRTVENIVCAPAPAPSSPTDVGDELLELQKLGYADSVADVMRPKAEAASRRRDFNLGRVLLAQGRAEEAVLLFEKLAEHDPEAFDVRIYLGHAYFQAARYRECRRICESILEEYPDSPFASLARAHLAIAEGDYRTAAIELDSGRGGMTAALNAAIGEAYLRIKKWTEAAAAFRSAILTDAGMATAHQGLAEALLAGRRYNQAAEAALDAIRLRYDLVAAHYILGRALSGMGLKKEASDAFAAGERLRSRITDL